MYDVVIVGADPAGANLARLIVDKYNVLLLDRRDMENENLENFAAKCCGGLLAPDAQKMIAKLGLCLPKDILVDPQLFAVRAIDLTNHLERFYQRFYFNMDRGKFDRWLVSLLPASTDKKFGASFINFWEIPGGYEIGYLHNGQERTVKTKILVGADGANSGVRKRLCSNHSAPQTYISIQEWFAYPCQLPYFTAIFDEEISDFYSWIIPKENALLIGSALKPDADAREKFRMLKSKLARSGFGFDHKTKTEGAFINRPMKPSQFCAGRDGVALIGEAAGAISPSSAEGISYALKSSYDLAACLESGTDRLAERYQRKAKDIRLNILMKNLKSPAMYHPLLRQLAMKSGLYSI